MSLLEEVCTDLPGRNLRSQRQDRRTAPMSVEQTLDQVGIAWAATAGAHGQAASELGFGGRGEGPGPLIAGTYPFDSLGTSDRMGTCPQKGARGLRRGPRSPARRSGEPTSQLPSHTAIV